MEKVIQNIVAEIKEKCIIKNTAIRDDIFGILEGQCTVVYYPIQDHKNRGFHIKKIVHDELEDFVYINTAKPVAEQIFAAAHELGHIFKVSDRVWKELGRPGEPEEQEEEEITNLFAAELLMPYKDFRRNFFAHMKEFQIRSGKVRVDEAVRLMVCQMSDFLVPYEAVRRRLVETKIMNQESADHLRAQNEEIDMLVKAFLGDQNTYLGNGTGVRTISGMRSLLEKAEKNPTIEPYLIQKIKKDFEVKEAVENHLEICIEGENSSNE